MGVEEACWRSILARLYSGIVLFFLNLFGEAERQSLHQEMWAARNGVIIKKNKIKMKIKIEEGGGTV